MRLHTYTATQIRFSRWPRGTRFAVVALPAAYIGNEACAEICGVLPSAVVNWRTRGHFPEPALVVGGRAYWLRDDIERWAATHLEPAQIRRRGVPEPISVWRLKRS